MGFLVDVVIFVVVAVPLFLLTQRRFRRRVESTGSFEVALRVVEGTQSGFGSSWRHGTVTPGPGVLSFRGGGPLGARFPRSSPFPIEVADASIDGVRHPSARQAWSINPALHVMTVRTPTAVLDLAGRADAMPRIVTGLTAYPGAQTP